MKRYSIDERGHLREDPQGDLVMWADVQQLLLAAEKQNPAPEEAVNKE